MNLGEWTDTGDLIDDDGRCNRGGEIYITSTTCDFVEVWYSSFEFNPTQIFNVGACELYAARDMLDGSTVAFSATLNVVTGSGGASGSSASGNSGYAALVMRLKTKVIVKNMQGGRTNKVFLLPI